MFASVREQTVYEALPRRALPEYLSKPWSFALAGVDVLAVLAACYVCGVPAAVAPAACAIVCGAAVACGIYRRSYAVHARDEVYHVSVAFALAALPLWAVLSLIAGVSSLAAFGTLLIGAAAVAALHAALALARHAGQPAAYARAAFVSPEAQWCAAHSAYAAVKREVHAAAAVLALLLLSPVLVVATLWILLESGRPVLFRQERVGRSGTRFTMYKFRTMVAGAGSSWARPSDARITRSGAILRRFSIDELPQLVNVVRGEMALVGPRPEMTEFAREFRRSVPHYDERHMLAPGLTGWAQVQLERNLEPRDVPNVVPYDLFYVEHASPVFDAVIILKTAIEFLFHRAV